MTEQASLGDISEENKDPERKDKWRNVRLKKILSLEYGNNLPTDDRDEGDIPVYGANGQVDTHSEPSVEKSGVIIGRKGSIAESVFSKEPFWPIDTTYYISNDETDENLYYIHYLLDHLDLQRFNAASAIPGLNRNDAYNLKTDIAPKDEQRRIASVLYNVDQAIQKTEEIIEQTQRVKKGLMQDLFTEGYFEHETRKVRLDAKQFEIAEDWEIVSVRDVTQRTHQGINTSADNVEYVDEGIPILQAEHITGGYFDYDDARRISSEDYDEYSEKYQPEEGDSLVCNIGTIGENIFVDSTKDFVIAWNLFLIKPNKDEIDSFYLNQALDWLKMTRRYYPLTSGSTTQFVNKTNMESLTFPLPNSDEQKKIAELLSEYDKRIGKLQQEKEQLQRLKKGLMQDLLTGSVRTGEDVEVLDEVVELEG